MHDIQRGKGPTKIKKGLLFPPFLAAKLVLYITTLRSIKGFEKTILNYSKGFKESHASFFVKGGHEKYEKTMNR